MQDASGYAVSSASAPAVAAYDLALDAQLHAWPGALAALDLALRHDPVFALAQAARALVLQAQGQGALARPAIAQARESCTGATERERSQVTLLADLVEGRPVAALQAVQTHAEHWPADALAMSTALGAFGLFAFSGRLDHDAARLAFVKRIAPHYPADNPWLLTQLSWAHTEAGEPEAGLELIQRSLALRQANGHAAHVMLHALFERHDSAAALRFADAWLPQYPVQAVLHGHLNWHAALSEIDLGDIDAALSRGLRMVLPHLQHALPLVGLTDAASLLWRLSLAGRDGQDWTVVRRYAEQKFPKGGNPFVELHLAMRAAAQRDTAGLAGGAARLKRQADAGHAGAVTALHWVGALQALLAGQPDAANAAFQACLADAPRLGGSHAQRTVINRTAAATLLPRDGA